MLQSGAGEQARLMQRILQEEVSMVVVMNEKGWTSYEVSSRSNGSSLKAIGS